MAENSVSLLFEDNASQWYVALTERWLGPLTAADVYRKIEGGEISWGHFGWKKGMGDWTRLCDIPTFASVAPLQPAKGAKPGAKDEPPPLPGKKAQPAKADKKEWFLYYNNTQFGPFTAQEIRYFLAAGKISGRVHAWRDGLEGWERLERVETFEDDVARHGDKHSAKVAQKSGQKSAKGPAVKSSKSSGQSDDQRGAPRKPLVARIMMASGADLVTGVCRDISVGGMQVLTDKVPGQAGAKLKLNVSPAGKAPSLEPFVAEGVVVRILEDGRGFSFRFERLSDSARRAIESYIANERLL